MGDDIASSVTIDADDFPVPPSWMEFSIASTRLEAGQTYCIVLQAIYGESGMDYVEWASLVQMRDNLLERLRLLLSET